MDDGPRTNIDDILASVTYTAHELPPQSSSSDANNTRHNLLQALTRSWTAERACPELLPYPSSLIDGATQLIRAQIETLEDGLLDPSSGSSLHMIIIQTELERCKFLVRSYLRARLAKLDSFAAYYYYYNNHASDGSSAEAEALLSPMEKEYLSNHMSILHGHFRASFLSALPGAALQKMDDRSAAATGATTNTSHSDGGNSGGMVDAPDVDQAVFVRCLKDQSSSSGRHNNENEDEDEDDENEHVIGVPGTDIRLSMRRGDVVVVRWSAVKGLVRRGVCELL